MVEVLSPAAVTAQVQQAADSFKLHLPEVEVQRHRRHCCVCTYQECCWSTLFSVGGVMLQVSMDSGTGVYRLTSVLWRTEGCNERGQVEYSMLSTFLELQVHKIYLKVFVSIHYHFLEYHRRIWYDGAKYGTVSTSRHTTTNVSVAHSNNQNTIHH